MRTGEKKDLTPHRPQKEKKTDLTPPRIFGNDAEPPPNDPKHQKNLSTLFLGGFPTKNSKIFFWRHLWSIIGHFLGSEFSIPQNLPKTRKSLSGPSNSHQMKFSRNVSASCGK